ncbi:unnamed protein product [Protopolystoma xenopodis]|uniref:Uncharacterized protein n=1 Tax=Protopolystoma xenopodis TaxID=117903 RepID=A0A448X130_9PLAT|nr:unnamed protein product [Protopolystoma xenopodis]
MLFEYPMPDLSTIADKLPDIKVSIGVVKEETLLFLASSLPPPLSQLAPDTGLPILSPRMATADFDQIMQAFVLPSTVAVFDIYLGLMPVLYPDFDGNDPRQRPLNPLTGAERKLVRLGRASGDMDFLCSTLANGDDDDDDDVDNSTFSPDSDEIVSGIDG